MRSKLVVCLLLVIAAMILLTGCPPAQPGKEGGTEPNVVGTWKGTITPSSPGPIFTEAAPLDFALFITKHTIPSFNGIAMLFVVPVSPAAIGYAIDMSGTLANSLVQITLDFSPQTSNITFTMTGILSGSTMSGTYIIIDNSTSTTSGGTWQVVKQL